MKLEPATFRYALRFLYVLMLLVAVVWYWRERHYEPFLVFIGSIIPIMSILEHFLSRKGPQGSDIVRSTSDTRSEGGSPQLVTNPAVLWAAAPGYSAIVNAANEERILRDHFPNSSLLMEERINASRLRQILANRKFDVVLLNVLVESNGDVVFGTSSKNTDRMPGEGLARLLELAGVKLLILATCNSIPLAGRLAHRVNMVAATGILNVSEFESWLEVFMRLLAAGRVLSDAFEVSSSTVRINVSLIGASNPSELQLRPEMPSGTKLPAQPSRDGFQTWLKAIAAPTGLAGLAVLVAFGVDRAAQDRNLRRERTANKFESVDRRALTVRVIHPVTEEPVVDAEIILLEGGIEVSRQRADIQGIAEFDVAAGLYRIVAKVGLITNGLEVEVKPSQSRAVVIRLAKP